MEPLPEFAPDAAGDFVAGGCVGAFVACGVIAGCGLVGAFVAGG